MSPSSQEYVGEVVQRMKRFKGAYTSHVHRLRSLLHEIQVTSSVLVLFHFPLDLLPPTHTASITKEN